MYHVKNFITLKRDPDILFLCSGSNTLGTEKIMMEKKKKMRRSHWYAGRCPATTTLFTTVIDATLENKFIRSDFCLRFEKRFYR